MGEYSMAVRKKIKAVMTGLVVIIICTLLLSLFISLIVYLTPAKDLTLNKWAILINGLSVLLGSLVAGLSAGEKGLVLGLITAILSILLLFLINGWSDLTGLKVAVCLMAGGIGGVIGVR